MNLMDRDESWNLMKHKVFAQGHCPQELEQIGRFIVEKCGGLPLAIVVISGILLSKDYQLQETWERIARNVNEAVNSGDGKFAEILSLSYKHLPHRLRPCFLYMGGFPEDYEIRVSKLVRLWTSEGFLKPNRSNNLEEVAEDYLEDLTKRSLVFVSERRPNGQIKAIKIHDLLRDLSLRKALEEKFLRVISKASHSPTDGILNSNRLSALVPITGDFSEANNSPIRTILLHVNRSLYHDLKCFKLLKTLDASTLTFTSFPVEICELFHLRYLAISYLHNCKLAVPCSLYKLRNLETLIILPNFPLLALIRPPYLVSLEIWKLPRLRHLIMFNLCFLNPRGGSLTATLETLYTLASVYNFTCSERILRMAPNLMVLKVIYPLDDLYETGWSKHRLNNLVHFQFLEKLNLHVEIPNLDISSPMVGYECRPNPWTLQKSDIAFPLTLKSLTLSGCQLPWTDMTIIGSLPDLEALKLRSDAACGDVWVTTEGEFCKLKLLLIETVLPQVWEVESSHFPRLRRLLLRDCHRLKEIPECIGDIATLELIQLDGCSKSINESGKHIEEEQRDNGNEELQVIILRSKRDDGIPPRIGRVSLGSQVAQFIVSALILCLMCCH